MVGSYLIICLLVLHLTSVLKGGVMADNLTAYVGHTYAAIGIPPDHPMGWVIKKALNQLLSESDWDHRQRRFFITRRYAFYDKQSKTLRIPRNFLCSFKATCQEYGLFINEVILPDYPVRKIPTLMNPKFTDRPHQVEAIKYLSDPSIHRKGLCLQPGAGKTYSATRAILNLGGPGLIIVGGLVDQWVNSIREQTDIGDQLYVLQGFKTLAMLIESDWQPDIIVASLSTMRNYANGSGNYEDLPVPFWQFPVKYGIKTKIIDEVHREFHATTLMDLRLNIPQNIYLSATFNQNNKTAKRIFDVVFPSDIRFGENDYEKYVLTYTYGYYGNVPERKCIGMNGYMQVKYEAQLFKNKDKMAKHFDRIINPLIVAHFLNVRKPGQKMIIFVQTRELLSHLMRYLQFTHKGLKIKSYVSGSSRDELDDVDIIITVPQKGGTGLDVKNLKTALNTISTKSPLAIEQWLGRLRKLEDGSDLIYVDIFDLNIDRCIAHMTDRRAILEKCSLYYAESVI